MAIFHVTYFFAQGTQGWVEQFFRSDSQLASSLTASLSLAQARYSILGAGVTLYRVRCSQVGAPRVSAFSEVNGPTLNTPASLAIQGAQIRLQASPIGQYTRNYLLRGLPQGALVQQGGLWFWASSIAGPAQQWLVMLTSGGWYLEGWGRMSAQFPLAGLTPVGTPPESVYPTPAEYAAAQAYGVSSQAWLAGNPTLPPQNLDTGQFPSIRIGRAGWDGLPSTWTNGINGAFEILDIDGPFVTYAGPLPFAGQWNGRGYAQLRPRIYVPIASAELVGPGTRAVGPARRQTARGFTLGQVGEVLGGIGLGVVQSVFGPLQGLGNDLLSYVTPGGVVPFPPPPVVPPPVPPPPPGSFVAGPATPRPVTLNNLLDVGTWLLQYCGYTPVGDQYAPIGIGRCENLVDTYVVMLGGIEAQVFGTTGWLAAIAAGIHAPTAYLTAASNAIEAAVPADASIILYGFSLGGIISELLYADPDFSPRIICMVTLASPIAGIPFSRAPIQRFAASLDPVPLLTPIGLLAWVYRLVKAIYQYIPIDSAHPVPPGCHQFFPVNPGLAKYGTFGFPFGGLLPAPQPPIELATMIQFTVPSLP